MATKRNQKIEFFTMPFEKYMEVVKMVNHYYLVISAELKNRMIEKDIDKWENSEIPDFMEAYLLFTSYKDFLEDKISNPTEEEIAVATKNNIKDVLFEKDELTVMNAYYKATQARADDLINKHNISFSMN